MRAVFLDRDGVICKNRSDHVKSVAEFEFLPGAIESLITLSQLNLPIIVVTNQAVINRGLATTDDIEQIHRHMVAEITAHGGRINDVLYCPHRPDEQCSCRKPEPGMLLNAAQRWGISLKNSYMVGDAATDIIAGQRAGCRTLIVLTGRGTQQLVPAFRTAPQPFTICRNLSGAVDQIIKIEAEDAHAQAGQPLNATGFQPAYPAPTLPK
jgi:D-glycero-D-manno-heptose 1,7-bisphosphate phosphatase